MIERSVFPFLLLYSLITSTGSTEDYCKVVCQTGGRHTMCLHSSASEACVNIKHPDSKPVRQAMIEAHNEFRNQFANQEFPNQKENGFPKAANMKQMYWDTELERIAKRWAEQCVFKHDDCRDVSRFTVGQNIGERGRYPGEPEPSTLSFKAWVDEINDADGSVQKSFPFSPGKMIGHFTQVAWAESQYLGCAEVLYDGRGMRNRYLVCNYGPGGNVVGAPMYQAGEPCSQCSDGLKCGQKYKYLCSDPKKGDDNVSGVTSLKWSTMYHVWFILFAITFIP